MNDFDRYLELELKDMLDPITEARPPARRGRRMPVLTVLPALAEIAGEALPGEPAVIPIPATPTL
jgi:hypothetical protein